MADPRGCDNFHQILLSDSPNYHSLKQLNNHLIACIIASDTPLDAFDSRPNCEVLRMAEADFKELARRTDLSLAAGLLTWYRYLNCPTIRSPYGYYAFSGTVQQL